MKRCPFCGAAGEIRLARQDYGTGASGMETPWPYAACSKGCVKMNPIPCDDWPYGRTHDALTSKQAEKKARQRWDQRVD